MHEPDHEDTRVTPHRRGSRDPHATTWDFGIEGPFNIGDPVHETITLRSLQAAGLVGPRTDFDDSEAWEYVRGVIWNDDPERLLFDNTLEETDNWASGYTWLRAFRSYAENARNGHFYGPGQPLLARSHFGDLQCLHGMASRDGELPQATRDAVLQWAEFLYAVSTGAVGEDVPVASVATGQMMNWLAGCPLSVKHLFLVGKAGEPRKRAIGALLHMIQDSFAEGHVERNGAHEIVEFHSYVNQDPDKHEHGDLFKGRAVEGIPGVVQAIERCAEVLRQWAAPQPWEHVKAFLEANVFQLAADARSAGPGEKFRQ